MHYPSRQSIVVAIATVATLGSGLVTLGYAALPASAHRAERLGAFFPISVLLASRLATLLIGIALVVSAVNVMRRKRRAWYTVLGLAGLAVVFHLTRGLDYDAAVLALALIALLLPMRDYFTVRSSAPTFRWEAALFAIAIGAAMVYGVVGFWLLDPREFGTNFTIGRSVAETARFMLLVGDSAIVPHTRHARGFLDSLQLVTALVVAYGVAGLFRPVVYLRRIRPAEHEVAADLLRAYGRTSIDYFKLWPDKSLFFGQSRRSFVAYAVSRGFAIALGDPVAPPGEVPNAIEEFAAFCRDNGWGVGFHQATGDFLDAYEAAGFHHLRIGDSAVVDLNQFTLEGEAGKQFRTTLRKVENKGIHDVRFEPPIATDTLDRIEEVSEEWLRIAGRRERTFTLGQFDRQYVRSTPVLAAVDADGRMLAFMNIIPSYRHGEATIDLMRRRDDAPSRVMDYLFVKVFLWKKEQGYDRFDLGLAPLAGLLEDGTHTREEAALRAFVDRLSFIFSYAGLRQYKAKFATYWEPSHSVYRSPLDLVRFAIALTAVSEVRPRRRRPGAAA